MQLRRAHMCFSTCLHCWFRVAPVLVSPSIVQQSADGVSGSASLPPCIQVTSQDASTFAVNHVWHTPVQRPFRILSARVRSTNARPSSHQSSYVQLKVRETSRWAIQSLHETRCAFWEHGAFTANSDSLHFLSTHRVAHRREHSRPVFERLAVTQPQALTACALLNHLHSHTPTFAVEISSD